MAAALEIRRYRPEDHDEVWALHNLALHHVGAHVGNGPWDDDLHHVEEVYLAAGGEFVVGLLDGQILAMGALKRTSPHGAQVTRMRVHPGFQRRGFGRAILSRLQHRAVELGFAQLHLDTTVGQVAAQQLYRSAGFTETGRTTFAGFDVIQFEKTLH